MKEGFDYSAINYLNSSDHKAGDDLEYLSRYFGGITFNRYLDVATAAGHCSKVFKSRFKAGIDLSFNMLKLAKSEFKLNCVCSNASEIPFRNDTFDLVSCRIALHHFPSPLLFFQEIFRILKKGGYFVLIDSIVDVDDAYLNVIEYFRDNTHIRSYTVKEIIEFAEDFRLINFVQIKRKHKFIEWAKRLNLKDEKILNLKQKFLNLPENIKAELELDIDKDEPISYTDKKGLFIFEKYSI